MKGVVFTEYLRFVATTHGDDMADDIIEDCDLESGGAYTSVGTYDHREMHALAAALATRTKRALPAIMVDFGRHLGHRFSGQFPDHFRARSCLFDFLESVHGQIHVEVRKLYPDAELPSFTTHRRDDEVLELDYKSCRPLAALAEGLILGASDFYGERVTVAQTPVGEGGDTFVRFAVHRA